MVKKIVNVRQKDAKDCGPCCLQSIVEYYGGYVSLEKIREDAYTGLNGTSVYHLIKAAENYGFDAVAKKNLDNDINQIMLPAIVHVHLKNGIDHFMCLYEIKNDNLVLMDPGSGKIKMPKNVFFQIFSGIVIELHPKGKIVYFEKNTTVWEMFFKVIIDNKNIIFWLVICSLLFTVLTIATSFYFKILYEYIINNVYKNTLKYIVYLFSLLIFLKIIFAYYKNYYENILTKNIDVNIIGSFLRHIYNLPLKVINTRKTGEIVSRISELQNVKELFTNLFSTSIGNLLLLFSSFIVLLFVNKKLFVILFIIMFIYIIWSITINKILYKRIKNNIELSTIFNANLIEHLNMIDSLKHLSKIDFAQKRSEEDLTKLLYDNYLLKKMINILVLVNSLIEEIGIFVINTLGFYYIYKGKMSLADLILFNSVMIYFINPVKELISYLPKLNFLKASFIKVCDFIDIEEEKLGKKERFVNGDIKFNKLFFSYNGYSNIINNLNITIKKGEKVLIKGKSGCGKSTICKILTRIYDPTKGTILINGKNILDYNINTIRNNILYVSQKESLYSNTIKNNINLESHDNQNFSKICKICLIEDIVKKRKFRYDFGIDSDSNISGGERQRIILARALMHNFNILVLDEALSELDIDKERQVINNLINHYPNKTIIYISHKNQEKLFDRTVLFEEVNNYE